MHYPIMKRMTVMGPVSKMANNVVTTGYGTYYSTSAVRNLKSQNRLIIKAMKAVKVVGEARSTTSSFAAPPKVRHPFPFVINHPYFARQQQQQYCYYLPTSNLNLSIRRSYHRYQHQYHLSCSSYPSQSLPSSPASSLANYWRCTLFESGRSVKMKRSIVSSSNANNHSNRRFNKSMNWHGRDGNGRVGIVMGRWFHGFGDIGGIGGIRRVIGIGGNRGIQGVTGSRCITGISGRCNRVINAKGKNYRGTKVTRSNNNHNNNNNNSSSSSRNCTSKRSKSSLSEGSNGLKTSDPTSTPKTATSAAAAAAEGASATGGANEAAAAAITPPPTGRQLMVHAMRSAVPMMGFGFMDNTIMIHAGHYVDCTLGVTFGLSTLAAAGIGQIFSGVGGVMFGDALEHAFHRLTGMENGTKVGAMTKAQKAMRISKIWGTMGGVLGVTLGCTLGLINLLFVDENKASLLKLNALQDGQEFEFEVEVDNNANPGCTTVVVRGPDVDGVLASITATIASVGCSVVELHAGRRHAPTLDASSILNNPLALSQQSLERVEDTFLIRDRSTQQAIDNDDLDTLARTILAAAKDPLNSHSLKNQVEELSIENMALAGRVLELETALEDRQVKIIPSVVGGKQEGSIG